MDSNIIANSKTNFEDIRIICKEKKSNTYELPYIIQADEQNRVQREIKNFQCKENKNNKETICKIFESFVINFLSINTKDTNFERKVIVLQETDTDTKPIGEYKIKSVSSSSGEKSLLSIKIPQTKSNAITLKIINEDSPPLIINGFIVYVINHFLIVRSDRDCSNIEVFYGNAEAQKPKYDFEKISAELDINNTVSVELGSEFINSAYKENKGRFSERYKKYFLLIFLLIILILGYIIVRNFIRISKS